MGHNHNYPKMFELIFCQLEIFIFVNFWFQNAQFQIAYKPDTTQ